MLVCTSFEESFPRVLLEAMVFGDRIVSTDVNGIPEMLTNTTRPTSSPPATRSSSPPRSSGLTDHFAGNKKMISMAHARAAALSSRPRPAPAPADDPRGLAGLSAPRMSETAFSFSHLESPASGAALPQGRHSLRGWVMPKPGGVIVDVRARVGDRCIPASMACPASIWPRTLRRVSSRWAGTSLCPH